MEKKDRDIPERGMAGRDDSSRITFLGTGTSHGIPMIGCSCRVCTSTDARDRRSRCSLLIELPQGNVLIDTAPELRLQCIAAKLMRVDAVMFTHTHADHVCGLDDLRRFCDLNSAPIPCYGSKPSTEALRRMFSYAFRELDEDYSERPRLRTVPIDGPFELLGKTVIPLPLEHGQDRVLGFRIDRWAYCTDCSGIPPETADQLGDLDLLILDGLRYTPHPTHFNVAQALAAVAEIRPRRAYLTHIAHEIKHDELEDRLPDGVYLSYDGLQLPA